MAPNARLRRFHRAAHWDLDWAKRISRALLAPQILGTRSVCHLDPEFQSSIMKTIVRPKENQTDRWTRWLA